MAIGTGTALLASAAIGATTSVIGGQKAKSAAKTAAAQAESAAQEQYDRTDAAIGDYKQANPFAGFGERYGSAMQGRLAGLMGYSDPQPSVFAPAGTAAAGAKSPHPVSVQRSVWDDPDMAASVGGQPTYFLNPVPQPSPSGDGFTYNQSPAGEQPSVWGGSDSRTGFLRSTPGYQFMMEEGMDALQHSLGARNGLYSGKAMKDIVRFAQGNADQTYDAAINRELAMGNAMANAAGSVLNATTGNAAQLADTKIDGAATRYSGQQDKIAGTMGGVKALTDGAMSVWGPQE